MQAVAKDMEAAYGQVHVIVENTKFTSDMWAGKTYWEGVLVDEWIKLDEDSTMMTCVVDALEP